MRAIEPGVQADWPEPVEVVRDGGTSPIVLICEHASNYLPAEYSGLGLSTTDLEDHIAWDIGAADVTRRLSDLLDAPAFLGTYSRLLIDLNRPPGVVTSIPERSENTEILGNRCISSSERSRREQRIFEPFHKRITGHLDSRQTTGQRTFLVSIHSFAPVYLGKRRQWNGGVLYGSAREFGRHLLGQLRADLSLRIGENEPYTVSLEEDFALIVHGANRGIAAVLVEIRNDGIGTAHGRDRWARRLADALRTWCSPGLLMNSPG